MLCNPKKRGGGGGLRPNSWFKRSLHKTLRLKDASTCREKGGPPNVKDPIETLTPPPIQPVPKNPGCQWQKVRGDLMERPRILPSQTNMEVSVVKGDPGKKKRIGTLLLGLDHFSGAATKKKVGKGGPLNNWEVQKGQLAERKAVFLQCTSMLAGRVNTLSLFENQRQPNLVFRNSRPRCHAKGARRGDGLQENPAGIRTWLMRQERVLPA